MKPKRHFAHAESLVMYRMSCTSIRELRGFSSNAEVHEDALKLHALLQHWTPQYYKSKNMVILFFIVSSLQTKVT
jgi:hypothetical protein